MLFISRRNVGITGITRRRIDLKPLTSTSFNPLDLKEMGKSGGTPPHDTRTCLAVEVEFSPRDVRLVLIASLLLRFEVVVAQTSEETDGLNLPLMLARPPESSDRNCSRLFEVQFESWDWDRLRKRRRDDERRRRRFEHSLLSSALPSPSCSPSTMTLSLAHLSIVLASSTNNTTNEI